MVYERMETERRCQMKECISVASDCSLRKTGTSNACCWQRDALWLRLAWLHVGACVGMCVCSCVCFRRSTASASTSRKSIFCFSRGRNWHSGCNLRFVTRISSPGTQVTTLTSTLTSSLACQLQVNTRVRERLTANYATL